MAQWWVVNDNGLNILPGNAAYGAGGTSATGAVQFRSPLDARRAAAGRTPDAEYPDGYLGHIADRRTDKLIQAVKNSLTAKSYQRGVHKGSRVDPKDYLWPDGFVQPMGGLEREEETATKTGNTISVRRFAPLGDPVERLAHMGKTSGMATPGELGRKLEEARRFGVSPSMNPIIPPDPQIMMPKYRIARVGDYESGK